MHGATASKEPVHIILVISDGTHLQHEIAASRYLHGDDASLVFHSFPYRNDVTTWDITTYNAFAWFLNKPAYERAHFEATVGYNPAQGGKQAYPLDKSGSDAYFLTELHPMGYLEARSAPATDSASSATSLATGHKTTGGRIAWGEDEEDGPLETVAEQMRKQLNASIGVVSTVPFNHATPAAFVSHNVHRNNYYTGQNGYEGIGIADYIINDSRPDVVIGGGHPLLTNPELEAGKGNISPQLYEKLKTSQEYIFVERQAGQPASPRLLEAAQTAAAQGKKLFGLFGGAGSNFETPVPEDNPGNPKLTRPTEEDPTFADAVVAALTVLEKDPDGFFLMAEQGDVDWANHANNFHQMIGAMSDLDQGVRAIVDFVEAPDNNLTWENTLLMVTSDHANSYMALSEKKPMGKGELPEQVGKPAAEGTYFGEFSYPGGEVTYGTHGHTNEPVSIYAKGLGVEELAQFEGTWYPGTKLIDQTQVYEVMAKVAGLKR